MRADILGVLGYDVTIPGDDLPAARLGETVEDFLGAGAGAGAAVQIVHVLGHAVLREPDSLLMLGSDGRHTPATSVERWLKHVELQASATSGR